MDRRAIFFLAAAVVSAALIRATPEDFAWVPTALCIVYALMAGASYLDSRSRD